MFQKEIFGPKNEKSEEIFVNFPNDAFSFPEKEISEEDKVSPTILMEKTIMNQENWIPNLSKQNILPPYAKSTYN